MNARQLIERYQYHVVSILLGSEFGYAASKFIRFVDNTDSQSYEASHLDQIFNEIMVNGCRWLSQYPLEMILTTGGAITAVVIYQKYLK